MERAENLIDNVAIGVFLISPKMEILWLNKTLKEWFPSIDVGKKPLCYRSFYSPSKKGICDYCPTIKTFEDGEVHSSETGVCADGNIYFVTAAPLKNEKGETTAVIETVQNITERKRAEEALRRSHNLLAAISRAQSHFIIDTDPHVLFDNLLSDILSLTQSEYGFIGEVLNTAKGEPYLKTHTITNIAWNEETRALYEKYAPNMEFYNMKTLFGAVITTGKPVIANNPSTDPRHGGLPKGHPPLNAFLCLPFYSGKRLVGMAGVANRPGGYDEGLVEYLQPLLTTCGNIIEAYRTDQLRKHAEEETKKTRDYLQTIITSMKDGVLIINKDYVITDANQVAAEMVECGREEIIGRHCYEVIRGESQPCKPPVVCELGEVLKTGEPIRVTHTLIDFRGGKHIVEVVASPIKDEKGEVKQIVDIARDITKEIEAEEALRKSEERYRGLVETAPDVIYTLSAEGIITSLNSVFEKITGWSRSEWLRKSFEPLVHPEDLPIAVETFQQVLRGESPLPYELRILSKSGDYLVGEFTSTPQIRNGKVVGEFGIARDVTERKRAEEELRKRIAELERMYKAFVGRELRMKELKEETKKLRERLGER